MWRHVPNLLTCGRLVLALVFFCMLAYYQYEGRGEAWFHTAWVVYLVALVTDFLDGYLARKWHVEGQFGRIIDPFVDKILVLGSFAFFAGKNFIIQHALKDGTRWRVDTITGVAPGIVVILIARELLVTTFRGQSEGQGQNFGAQFSGKVKMVVQSVTILVILTYVNYYKWLTDHNYLRGATYFRDFCVWATVAITVISGLLYIQRAIAMYRLARVREEAPAPVKPAASAPPQTKTTGATA
jgi:CDP-diacylglycerol--glycerol-3-phosphate 3-phosphatidyltransferase